VIVVEFIRVSAEFRRKSRSEVNAMLSIDRTFVTFQERAHPGGLKSNFIQISCLSRLLIDWARFDSYFGFEIMGQNDHQYG
jgi:hypothetical protein